MVSAAPAMTSGPGGGGNVPREALSQVLQKLILVDKEGYFQMPVDEVLHHAPNYYIIIKNPMCFFDMKNRLEAGAYTNLRQLREDFELICGNARTFNKNTTKVYKAAMNLHQKGSKIIKQHEVELKRAGRGGAKHHAHGDGLPSVPAFSSGSMDYAQVSGAFHPNGNHLNGFGGASPHLDEAVAADGPFSWMPDDYQHQNHHHHRGAGDEGGALTAHTSFFSHQQAAWQPAFQLQQQHHAVAWPTPQVCICV